MNTWQRFKNIRGQKKTPFGFRFSLTFMVTLEMLICLFASHYLDILIHQVITLNWTFPFELEQLIVCLLVGIVATSQLSRFFFHPIQRLIPVLTWWCRNCRQQKSFRLILYPMFPMNSKHLSAQLRDIPHFFRIVII